ncbi:histidine phosphatase superfamily [Podospora fimiseda]|uniref:Histidine phosphatase superfamily n=1 Tax=Podospora fimiseda TaxID=252190 RepID=A0AAN7BMD1_9PEZI|nr:histidine phosphatase superfamily [Podospora fimiseda]
MPPTIILVRHAQALHNVDRDYTIHDPPLSELGRAQCLDLKSNLVPKIPSQLDVELIIVSPMKRTIETALIAFPELINRGVPIVAHAGWQENSSQCCDIGSSLNDLPAEFPQVDFSQVDRTFPLKFRNEYAYSRPAILARGQSVLKDLYERKEKAIIVVSHSGFLRAGVTGRWFFNADYRVFNFDGGPTKLKESDMTKGKGGLGWSFEEETELGDGLPDVEENTT